MQVFEGKSSNGSVQDAIDAAIGNAIAANFPDAEINWKLLSVSGRAGTIVGVREVVVCIEVNVG